MPDFGARTAGQGENERLVQFLRSSYEVLNTAVETGRDSRGNTLFHPELIEPMRLAWAEMPPAFIELEARIRLLSREQLEEHGFTGAQLNFKLGVVNFIWERFNEFGGSGFFGKLIDAIDAILDSLIDATGFGAIIREIKEAIRNALID